MRSKVLYVFSVLVVISILLSACSGAATQAPAEVEAPTTEEPAVKEPAAEEPATEKPTTEETVELTIIIEQVPDYDIVAELTKEFEAENPNIKIIWDAMPYDAMRDKILTSFLAPEGTYDIIIVDNPWMDEFPAAGFLSDLTEYVNSTPGYNWEDFEAPIRELAEHDGKIYAIPYLNYAVGLIVRQDLFDDPELKAKFKEKTGKDLAIPTTNDEYVEVGKFFKENGIAGAAMQPQAGYKILEEWKNWLYAEGGNLMDADGKPTINSEAAKKALEKYIDMYQNAAPENSLNWGFDDALRSMASGESATMISYNWMLPSLNDPEGQAGELAGKFQLYPVPGGKAVLGAWYWAIPENCVNKDAAWKYISWLTSPEIDKKRTAMGGGVTRISSAQDPTVWEEGYGEYFYKTVDTILANSEPLARGVHADEISIETGNVLNAIVAGTMSIDEGLAAIEAKINEIQSK
ncbi:MAG: sugar ABC transporter substrate-binding protein [Chloroflexi bacterium]|nr:sugar ABC transporter substrate-binding protein [Chloroflexota bacterium]